MASALLLQQRWYNYNRQRFLYLQENSQLYSASFVHHHYSIYVVLNFLFYVATQPQRLAWFDQSFRELNCYGSKVARKTVVWSQVFLATIWREMFKLVALQDTRVFVFLAAWIPERKPSARVQMLPASCGSLVSTTCVVCDFMPTLHLHSVTFLLYVVYLVLNYCQMQQSLGYANMLIYRESPRSVVETV